jgi:hypothetical protein
MDLHDALVTHWFLLWIREFDFLNVLLSNWVVLFEKLHIYGAVITAESIVCSKWFG